MPWGIATEVGATGAGVLALAVGVVAFVVKVALLGAALAVAEVFLARLRLFRVPELLAGSFLLALLAVTRRSSWHVRRHMTDRLYVAAARLLRCGALLLTAVLVLWRRELSVIVRVFALQGVALAGLVARAGRRPGLRRAGRGGRRAARAARRRAALPAAPRAGGGRATTAARPGRWSTSPPRCSPRPC